MNKLTQPKYTNERRTEAFNAKSFELKSCNALTNHTEVIKQVTFVEFVTETYGKENDYPIQLPEDFKENDTIIKCRFYLIQTKERLQGQLLDLKHKLATVTELLEEAGTIPSQYIGEKNNE